MPSKIKKPSIQFSKELGAFAFIFANESATANAPGFAGKTIDYPATAVAAIVRAVKDGHLAARVPDSVDVRDASGQLAAVVSSQDESVQVCIVARDHKPLFYHLAAHGWDQAGCNRRFARARKAVPDLPDIKRALETALAENVTTDHIRSNMSQKDC